MSTACLGSYGAAQQYVAPDVPTSAAPAVEEVGPTRPSLKLQVALAGRCRPYLLILGIRLRNSLRKQRAVLLGRVQTEVDVAEMFVGAVLADALHQRRDLKL